MSGFLFSEMFGWLQSCCLLGAFRVLVGEEGGVPAGRWLSGRRLAPRPGTPLRRQVREELLSD